MDEPIIATELAAVLKTVSPLMATLENAAGEAGQIAGSQSGDIVTRPAIIVHAGQFTPYGPRRKGEIEIEIRSRIGEQETDAPSHGDRFDALWKYLFGDTGQDYPTTLANMAAAKVVVKGAVTSRGKIELIEYCPAQQAVTADAQDNELRTVLKLLLIFRFL